VGHQLSFQFITYGFANWRYIRWATRSIVKHVLNKYQSLSLCPEEYKIIQNFITSGAGVTKGWNIGLKIRDHERSKSRTLKFTKGRNPEHWSSRKVEIPTIEVHEHRDYTIFLFFQRWFSRDPFFYPTHQSRVDFRCSWLIGKGEAVTNIRILNVSVHFLCKTPVWL